MMKNIKKRILMLVVLTAWVGMATAQMADVYKSDGISAETQGQFEEAAKAFEAAVKAFKEQEVIDTTSIYRAGANYLRIKQFEKAIPFLEECVELEYSIGRSLRMLSDAWEGLNDFAKSEAVLLQGKEKCPDEAIEFDKRLAYLYFNTGQFEKAAGTFEILNAQIPGNKNYMFLHGFALERLRRFEEAITWFKQVQQSFPDDKQSKKMHGVALFQLTEEQNEREVKRYESMKNARIEDYIGTRRRLEEIQQGYEEARLILEDCLQTYPDDKQIISTLYLIYKKQSKEREAAQMKSRM